MRPQRAGVRRPASRTSANTRVAIDRTLQSLEKELTLYNSIAFILN